MKAKWKECRRRNCSLTAYWQVVVRVIGGDCSHSLITNLVICGIHKDTVELDDFSDLVDKVDPEHYHNTQLDFVDISYGIWLNPKTGAKEKYW